jgi:hypothetical protein
LPRRDVYPPFESLAPALTPKKTGALFRRVPVWSFLEYNGAQTPITPPEDPRISEIITTRRRRLKLKKANTFLFIFLLIASLSFPLIKHIVIVENFRP